MEVLSVKQEIFEKEDGRILVMHIKRNGTIYCLINMYVVHVNDVKNEKLLELKQRYVEWFINLIKKYIRENENIILMGDANMARSITPYDLWIYHPRPHSQPGFSELELRLFQKFFSNVKNDLIDVQKKYAPNKVQYSFYSQRTIIKNIFYKHNKGLVVDFVFISKHLYKYVKKFEIRKKDYEFNLSDHLPLRLDINI